MPDDAQYLQQRQRRTSGWAFEYGNGNPPIGKPAVGHMLFKRSRNGRSLGQPWATELEGVEATIQVTEIESTVRDYTGVNRLGTIRFRYSKPAYNDALGELELKLEFACIAHEAEFENILKTGEENLIERCKVQDGNAGS